MPHIIIKTISGPSQSQLQQAAEEIKAVINKRLGKAERYISVAVEEYSLREWEGVYNEHVKDNPKVVIKPGYTDPKTFT